jgi:hypothetical protein
LFGNSFKNKKMQLKKIFFQSSLPRSGSTFMQCILNNDPRIYAGGTDGCLELLFGARGNFQSSPECIEGS